MQWHKCRGPTEPGTLRLGEERFTVLQTDPEGHSEEHMRRTSDDNFHRYFINHRSRRLLPVHVRSAYTNVK